MLKVFSVDLSAKPQKPMNAQIDEHKLKTCAWLREEGLCYGSPLLIRLLTLRNGTQGWVGGAEGAGVNTWRGADPVPTLGHEMCGGEANSNSEPSSGVYRCDVSIQNDIFTNKQSAMFKTDLFTNGMCYWHLFGFITLDGSQVACTHRVEDTSNQLSGDRWS